MTKEEIRAWRDEMGFNQVEAAKALRITAQRLRAYEQGVWPNGNEATVPEMMADYCRHLLAIRKLDREVSDRAKGSRP